jgi:hypothetical protein
MESVDLISRDRPLDILSWIISEMAFFMHCTFSLAGLCPGLFTSSELLVMSSKMQTGRVKKTVEGAQQTFARAVRRQLHVFVLWDTIVTDGTGGTGALFNRLSSGQPSSSRGLLEGAVIKEEESSRLCFASLYRACSYIDVYQPWSKQDYCDIALSWWKRGVVCTL